MKVNLNNACFQVKVRNGFFPREIYSGRLEYYTYIK